MAPWSRGPDPHGLISSLAPKKVKIIVFGESGVGKTCFTDMFTLHKHYAWHDPTRDSLRRILDVDGVNYILELIDLSSSVLREPGETLDLFMFNLWCSQADGVVLMYDITSKSSYDHVTIDAYLHMILNRNRMVKDLKYPPGIPYPAGMQRFGCVLVGNKADLPDEKREVDKDLAHDWAESQGIDFFELDSFREEPINEAMQALIRSMIRAKRRDEEDIEEERMSMDKEKEAGKKRGQGDGKERSMFSNFQIGASFRQVFRKSPP